MTAETARQKAADVEMMRIALEEIRAGEQVVIGTHDVKRDMRILRELGATTEEIAKISFMGRRPQ